MDESGAVEQPAASLSAGPLGGESRKKQERMLGTQCTV